MTKAYVVMKQRWSPIVITRARPHAVFMDREKAVASAKAMDRKAQLYHYWVESVDLVNGETK